MSESLWRIQRIPKYFKIPNNDPKFLDRQIRANSVDQDQEQSDQGLHC